MTSYFMNKDKEPTANDLRKAIGATIAFWNSLVKFAVKLYPQAREEWKFAGAKYGWGFRVSDKRRALIYLGPRDGHFIVSMVFGNKAYSQIMESTINDAIKKDLENARVYAEGRGIRLEVHDDTLIDDIKKLLQVKVAN